jgi:hypothetical protein
MPPEKSHEAFLAQFGPTLGPSLEATHRRMVVRGSLWVGLKTGLKAGLVYIPLVVFAYAVLVRLGWAYYEYYFSAPHKWSLPGETVWTYPLPLLLEAIS